MSFWEGFEKRSVSGKWIADRIAGGMASRTAPGARKAIRQEFTDTGVDLLSKKRLRQEVRNVQSVFPKAKSKRSNIDSAHDIAKKYPKPGGSA